jgi:hypothetical protein
MPPKARGAAKTPNEALLDELRKASAACAEAIKKVAGAGSDKQFERINKAEKAWVKLLVRGSPPSDQEAFVVLVMTGKS